MSLGGIEPPSTGPKPEILSIKLQTHKNKKEKRFLYVNILNNLLKR